MRATLAIIVPAYNEEQSIAAVIADIRTHQPQADIVVVNDSSRDQTEHVARAAGVTVLSLSSNLGIGGAVQTGLIYARNEGYQYAAQFDGDGQHIASEIARLLEPLRSDEVDVVIGSRFLGDSVYRSSFPRRAGIRLVSIVNRLLTGHRILDNTSGFRAYNRKAIAFLADNYPQDYPEPEAVVQLARAGFRIREVPARMQVRVSGRSSIRGITHSLYYVAEVLLSNIIGTSESGRQKDNG